MTVQQQAAVDALLRIRSAPPTSLAEERARFAEQITKPVPADVEVTELTLGDRPALRLAGRDAEGPGALLYFHGGGFVVGSSRTHAALTVGLARRAGVPAFSLDYRLAPEDPFPAAVEDGVAAYRALLDDGRPSRPIVLAGDSAGGGLAVATLVAARDAVLPLPAAVVVLSPWVDMTLSGDSLTALDGIDPIFVKSDIDGYDERYVGAGDRSHPLASPVFADLSGLPPLLIHVGAHELLLDDAVRLAGRAGNAGVDVTLRVWAGVPHVFQHFAGLLDEADAALDAAGAFLRRHLSAAAIAA